MGEIALAEGHKEAYPFDLGYIKGKRLDFLMVEKIHILPPYFIKVIFTFYAHGRDFYPMPVFPIATRSRNLAQIYFGIEVGRKRIAVVTAVTVKDINGVDSIELVFFA